MVEKDKKRRNMKRRSSLNKAVSTTEESASSSEEPMLVDQEREEEDLFNIFDMGDIVTIFDVDPEEAITEPEETIAKPEQVDNIDLKVWRPEYDPRLLKTQVLGEDGKPLKTYHGSSSEFENFNIDYLEDTLIYEGGLSAKLGLYLSPNPLVAEAYKGVHHGQDIDDKYLMSTLQNLKPLYETISNRNVEDIYEKANSHMMKWRIEDYMNSLGNNDAQNQRNEERLRFDINDVIFVLNTEQKRLFMDIFNKHLEKINKYTNADEFIESMKKDIENIDGIPQIDRQSEIDEGLQNIQERIKSNMDFDYLVPSYLVMHNPLVTYDWKGLGSYDDRGLVEAILLGKKLGHDGIIIKNIHDVPLSNWMVEYPEIMELFNADHYIIFDPKQAVDIKTAETRSDEIDSTDLALQTYTERLTPENILSIELQRLRDAIEIRNQNEENLRKAESSYAYQYSQENQESSLETEHYIIRHLKATYDHNANNVKILIEQVIESNPWISEYIVDTNNLRLSDIAYIEQNIKDNAKQQLDAYTKEYDEKLFTHRKPPSSDQYTKIESEGDIKELGKDELLDIISKLNDPKFPQELENQAITTRVRKIFNHLSENIPYNMVMWKNSEENYDMNALGQDFPHFRDFIGKIGMETEYSFSEYFKIPYKKNWNLEQGEHEFELQLRESEEYIIENLTRMWNNNDFNNYSGYRSNNYIQKALDKVEDELQLDKNNNKHFTNKDIEMHEDTLFTVEEIIELLTKLTNLRNENTSKLLNFQSDRFGYLTLREEQKVIDSIEEYIFPAIYAILKNTDLWDKINFTPEILYTLEVDTAKPEPTLSWQQDDKSYSFDLIREEIKIEENLPEWQIQSDPRLMLALPEGQNSKIIGYQTNSYSDDDKDVLFFSSNPAISEILVKDDEISVSPSYGIQDFEKLINDYHRKLVFDRDKYDDEEKKEFSRKIDEYKEHIQILEQQRLSHSIPNASYMLMSNPMVVKDLDTSDYNLLDKIIETAKERGHDSVILKSFKNQAPYDKDMGFLLEGDQYIIFDPRQAIDTETGMPLSSSDDSEFDTIRFSEPLPKEDEITHILLQLQTIVGNRNRYQDIDQTEETPYIDHTVENYNNAIGILLDELIELAPSIVEHLPKRTEFDEKHVDTLFKELGENEIAFADTYFTTEYVGDEEFSEILRSQIGHIDQPSESNITLSNNDDIIEIQFKNNASPRFSELIIDDTKYELDLYEMKVLSANDNKDDAKTSFVPKSWTNEKPLRNKMVVGDLVIHNDGNTIKIKPVQHSDMFSNHEKISERSFKSSRRRI